MADKVKKILVVDGEDSVRDLSSRILNNSYTVVVAQDGEEDLLKAGEEQPDIMLLDIMLPDER